MNKVFALALNTMREAIRNRVLYSVLAFAILLVGISAIFGSASIGDSNRYVKDFALMAISLFGVIIAVMLGVNLLHQELSKKTILNTLSKPVARWHFIVGKFLGLLATLTLILSGMALGLALFMSLIEGYFDWGILLATAASLLEVMIIIAFAVFFSSFLVTPTLAGLFSIGCFIAGRSTQYLDYFFSEDMSPLLQSGARWLSALLPRLDHFLLADRLVHEIPLEPSTFPYLVGYALFYTATLLLLTVLIFERREFK